jgi:hypothetical protein
METPTGKEMDMARVMDKDQSHFRSSFAFMAVQGMHKEFGTDGQIWQRGKDWSFSVLCSQWTWR